jgi:hypothetical protein
LLDLILNLRATLKSPAVLNRFDGSAAFSDDAKTTDIFGFRAAAGHYPRRARPSE